MAQHIISDRNLALRWAILSSSQCLHFWNKSSVFYFQSPRSLFSFVQDLKALTTGTEVCFLCCSIQKIVVLLLGHAANNFEVTISISYVACSKQAPGTVLYLHIN